MGSLEIRVPISVTPNHAWLVFIDLEFHFIKQNKSFE